MSADRTPSTFGKVAVAMGGFAAEREISLISGTFVLNALKSQGIDVIAFDPQKEEMTNLTRQGVERVFNCLHGRGGEDGQLQGALDLLEIPYTGSGVLGSALGMDKLRTKLCWVGAGLPTPKWVEICSEQDIETCVATLGFPVMVKPALEGSSIGMSKANNIEELQQAVSDAMQFDSPVIAEQWVDGSEYTVAILNGKSLPMIRLETPNDFYDYEAKYQSDSTHYFCPCGLGADQEAELQNLALKAFELLGGAGWGRVDLMIDTKGQVQLLEINTVPGMTDHSLVPMAAKQAGLSFENLVLEILNTSFSNGGEK